jgi:hypothetical protein
MLFVIKKWEEKDNNWVKKIKGHLSLICSEITYEELTLNKFIQYSKLVQDLD